METLILKKSFLFIAISCFSCLIISCGGSPNDGELKASVDKAIQENNDFKGVSAEVKDGVVTLNGECKGNGCDSLIQNKVNEIEGVKGIENHIVKNTATDLTLRTAVQSIISNYEGVQADVAGGAVVLRGTIDKNQVEPLIEQLKLLKPEKLDNQLALK